MCLDTSGHKGRHQVEDEELAARLLNSLPRICLHLLGTLLLEVSLHQESSTTAVLLRDDYTPTSPWRKWGKRTRLAVALFCVQTKLCSVQKPVTVADKLSADYRSWFLDHLVGQRLSLQEEHALNVGDRAILVNVRLFVGDHHDFLWSIFEKMGGMDNKE